MEHNPVASFPSCSLLPMPINSGQLNRFAHLATPRHTPLKYGQHIPRQIYFMPMQLVILLKLSESSYLPSACILRLNRRWSNDRKLIILLLK
jgi:hypothetical protein